MSARKADRVIVGIPGEMGRLIRERAKAAYRSVGMETLMILERGLEAERNEKGA